MVAAAVAGGRSSRLPDGDRPGRTDLHHRHRPPAPSRPNRGPRSSSWSGLTSSAGWTTWHDEAALREAVTLAVVGHPGVDPRPRRPGVADGRRCRCPRSTCRAPRYARAPRGRRAGGGADPRSGDPLHRPTGSVRYGEMAARATPDGSGTRGSPPAPGRNPGWRAGVRRPLDPEAAAGSRPPISQTGAASVNEPALERGRPRCPPRDPASSRTDPTGTSLSGEEPAASAGRAAANAATSRSACALVDRRCLAVTILIVVAARAPHPRTPGGARPASPAVT